MQWESVVPTPFAVRCCETFDVGKEWCNGGKLIYLTAESYEAQMLMPDARWKCPRCGGSATWDDDNYEEYLDALEACNCEEDKYDPTCPVCAHAERSR